MKQIKSEAATIRWRSNGAFTVPDGAARPDRRLPHRRRDLAQPVRRVDLRPRARAARRLPVAGPRRRRAAAGRLPVRGPGAVPRAQAPAAPALHRRPVSRRADYVDPVRRRRRPPAGRRPHDRHLGRHRREVAPGGRGAGRARGRRGRGHRPALARRRGTRSWWPSRSAAPVALLVVHEDVLHRRLRRRGGGVDRRALLHRPRRAGAPGRRRSTPTCAYEPTLETAILPQVDDIVAAVVDVATF